MAQPAFQSGGGALAELGQDVSEATDPCHPRRKRHIGYPRSCSARLRQLEETVVGHSHVHREADGAREEAVKIALRLLRRVLSPGLHAKQVRRNLTRSRRRFARGLTTLIRVLQEQLELVAGERDAALTDVLAAHTHPSHRSLSTDLYLSPQRVDQLARIARRGGRGRAG